MPVYKMQGHSNVDEMRYIFDRQTTTGEIVGKIRYKSDKELQLMTGVMYPERKMAYFSIPQGDNPYTMAREATIHVLDKEEEVAEFTGFWIQANEIAANEQIFQIYVPLLPIARILQEQGLEKAIRHISSLQGTFHQELGFNRDMVEKLHETGEAKSQWLYCNLTMTP